MVHSHGVSMTLCTRNDVIIATSILCVSVGSTSSEDG